MHPPRAAKPILRPVGDLPFLSVGAKGGLTLKCLFWVVFIDSPRTYYFENDSVTVLITPAGASWLFFFNHS